MTQDEGEVWYLLNEQKNTIGLIKVKTAWYTILRALREKAVYCFTTARKRPDWSLHDRIMSTHKRFREIQFWLKFSDNYLRQWKVRSLGLFSLFGRFLVMFSIVQVYLRFIMGCFHLPKPFSLSWIENLGNEIVNVFFINFRDWLKSS